MEQFPYSLDNIFQALADPTRRAVLERLGHGPASVGELAMPFDMALPSFMKHIAMLESAGLIRTKKTGRVRLCTIEQQRLTLVDGWLADQRTAWKGRPDRFENLASLPKGRSTLD